MIGRLRGQLLLKKPPELLIDVQGVGYEVFAPMSTFYHLPELNSDVTLFTHFVTREDAQLLFGFCTEQERQLFRQLIKINGVGPKLALAILSVDVPTFLQAVAQKDIAQLTRLPGIGKKTAERLVVELKDKLENWEKETGVHVPISASFAGDFVQEAIDALVSLGYKLRDATQMIKKIGDECGSSEELIRKALQGASA